MIWSSCWIRGWLTWRVYWVPPWKYHWIASEYPSRVLRISSRCSTSRSMCSHRVILMVVDGMWLSHTPMVNSIRFRLSTPSTRFEGVLTSTMWWIRFRRDSPHTSKRNIRTSRTSNRSRLRLTCLCSWIVWSRILRLIRRPRRRSSRRHPSLEVNSSSVRSSSMKSSRRLKWWTTSYSPLEVSWITNSPNNSPVRSNPGYSVSRSWRTRMTLVPSMLISVHWYWRRVTQLNH